MRKSIRLSQNFLRSPKLVSQLVADAGITKDDVVVEIGPGKGIITGPLVERAHEVIAVEADPVLAHALQTKYAYRTNLRVHTGSFLSFALPKQPYKVFANIPFNITADIVKKLLEALLPPQDSFLIIQREAAQKFAGRPGKETLLSIISKPWFGFSISHTFRPEDFTPRPNVAIVLLHISKRDQPLIKQSDAVVFRDFVAYIFNHATPNIHRALMQLLPIKEHTRLRQVLHIEESAIPSQLAIEDWITLFESFYQHAAPSQAKRIQGTYSKMKQDASNIEKYHRTRLDKNWRSFGLPPKPATS